VAKGRARAVGRRLSDEERLVEREAPLLVVAAQVVVAEGALEQVVVPGVAREEVAALFQEAGDEARAFPDVAAELQDERVGLHEVAQHLLVRGEEPAVAVGRDGRFLIGPADARVAAVFELLEGGVLRSRV
jgi:hypothetical protein